MVESHAYANDFPQFTLNNTQSTYGIEPNAIAPRAFFCTLQG